MFPPKYIAEKLQISEKQPIIRIINVTYMSDETPFDYTELFLHPELYQLNVVKKR
jgi:DNA-binding GntR family transcriptional regulator